MLPAARAKAIPLVVMLELAMTLRKHWMLLTPGERAHLAALLRKSQGRPNRLSAKERGDVRRLVGKMQPAQMAKSIVPVGRKVAKLRRT